MTATEIETETREAERYGREVRRRGKRGRRAKEARDRQGEIGRDQKKKI